MDYDGSRVGEKWIFVEQVNESFFFGCKIMDLTSSLEANPVIATVSHRGFP